MNNIELATKYLPLLDEVYKEASKTVTLKEVNGSIIECSGAP